MALRRIGMVLPSSNTVVEPECIRLSGLLPDASVHFARFALTAVSVANPAAAYYDSGAILGAARLLADARCHAICWNGSAGGVVGFERDRQLCREITTSTGIPATTSSLALLDQFERSGVRRFAMVTLNPPEMNRTIKAHFAAAGYECVAATERSDIADNFAMAAVTPDEIRSMALACVAACTPRPDALIIYGTNTRGALVANPLRDALGLPVYDSVSWGMFGALHALGRDITALVN